MSLTSAKKLDSCLANDDNSAAVVLKKHVYSPISDYEVVPGFFDLEHVAAGSCYKNCTVYTICNPTTTAAAAATANCASCSCEKGLSCFPTKSTIVKKIQFLRALTTQSSASIAPYRRQSYNLKKRVEDMMQSSSEDCDPVKLKSAESTSSGAAAAAQLDTNQSDERNHNKGTTVVLVHYAA